MIQLLLIITVLLLIAISLLYRAFLTGETTNLHPVLLFVGGSAFMFVGSAVLVGDLSELLFFRSVGSCLFGLMFAIGARRGRNLTKPR